MWRFERPPTLTSMSGTPEGVNQAVKGKLLWSGLRTPSNFRAAALTNSFTRRDLLSARAARFVMSRMLSSANGRIVMPCWAMRHAPFRLRNANPLCARIN